MYDVIIIGAGPAGSSAAKRLIGDGFRVLLVEKAKLPRNKSCSGILIKKSMDLVRAYFHEDVPLSVMCSPTDNRGMIFTNDDGQEFIYEQEGLNIWRSSFDHWLTKNTGAEIRDNTIALSCEEQNDRVTVTLKGETEYSEKAKIVIVCEGVSRTIKRKLIQAPKDYIITYQTFNIGSIKLDPHYFYAYLQPNLSEYDAWFNVKDKFLIFGVAVRDASKIEHYYSEFIAYMKSRHNVCIDKEEKREKWMMPHILPDCPIDYGKGRVLFAGEAAGFLNPMGEGISAGLESGYAAAEAIRLANFDMQSIYQTYENNTSELRHYMKRQWNYVASLSSKFKHMADR